MKNKSRVIVAAVLMLAAGILFSWGLLDKDSQEQNMAAEAAAPIGEKQGGTRQTGSAAPFSQFGGQPMESGGQTAESGELAAKSSGQPAENGGLAAENGGYSAESGKQLTENGKTLTENGVQPESAETADASIWIHVCGQVACPGVYQAPKGSRVYQLVEMAGGLTEEASEEGLNMAAFVSDGQQIYVPSQEEAASMPRPAAGEAAASGDKAAETPAKVNINTAGIAQLCTLRGIGESRAKDIIAYRESHGAFARVEDIMKVSGIKQAAFDKIKDSISVTD